MPSTTQDRRRHPQRVAGVRACIGRAGRAGTVALAAWLAAGSVAAGESAVDAGRAMHLLKVQCLSCHNAEKRKGDLDFSTREALLKGNDDGPVVGPAAPGAGATAAGAAAAAGEGEVAPGQSRFLRSLAAEADPHMPPKKQLSSDQIGLFAAWIEAGAPWDESVVRGGESVPRPVSLGPLPAGYHPVMAMALSPDGSRLAVGSGAELSVFDITADGAVLRARGRAHLDPVQSIAWTPDGGRLVTGAFRRVLVWRAAGLEPEREIVSGLTDRITAIQITPEGPKALVADGLTSEKGVVRVVDLGSGRVERSWAAHGDTIFAMALAADGAALATAGGDGLVKVWNVADGRETAKLEAHGSQALCLDLSGDAAQLVTGGADRTLKVWDVRTRENTVALATKSTAFNAVTWNASGSVFAVTEDGAVWRYSDMKPHTGAQSSDTGSERQIGRIDGTLNCLAVTPDGSRIFAGTSDGRLHSWNKDGQAAAPIEIRTAPLTAAASPAAPTPAPQ